MLLCERSLVVLAVNWAAIGLLQLSIGELLHRMEDHVLPPAVPMGLEPVPLPTERLEGRCEFQPTNGNRSTLDISGVSFRNKGSGAAGWAVVLRGRKQAPPAPDFIGRSAVVRELLEFFSQVGGSRRTFIPVIGESGDMQKICRRAVA